jgi:hypothetical protein
MKNNFFFTKPTDAPNSDYYIFLTWCIRRLYLTVGGPYIWVYESQKGMK